MGTQIDLSETSQQASKPPAAARDAQDPPTPGVVIDKSIIKERKTAPPLDSAAPVQEERQKRIALVAYYLAERRGFDRGEQVAEGADQPAREGRDRDPDGGFATEGRRG